MTVAIEFHGQYLVLSYYFIYASNGSAKILKLCPDVDKENFPDLNFHCSQMGKFHSSGIIF